MNYRILNVEEWDRLQELLPEDHLPAPEIATAAIAEDEDGEIQALLLLQLSLRMEPIVVRDPKVSFKRLHQTLHDAVADDQGLVYFALTDNPRVQAMAEHVGMKVLDQRVLVGRI